MDLLLNARIFAFVAKMEAIKLSAEGMKAENKIAEMHKEELPYTGKDFGKLSDNMIGLSKVLLDLSR